MKLGGYVFGIFPRSERLIDISRLGNGFMEAARNESKSLMEIQAKYGLSYIDDPQLTWDDMFRPIILSQKGFSINGLARYFETNTFYKLPVIEGKIEYKDYLGSYVSLSGNLSVPYLISLPDPFTFFCMSKNNWYSDESSLIRDIGKLLANISHDLKSQGYNILVLKGPMYTKCDATRLEESIKDSLHEIKESFNGKVILHTYFGDPAKNARVIKDSSVDGVGFDLKSIKYESIQSFCLKDISVGAIDGLNTKQETIDELKTIIKNLKGIISSENIYITNNVDLEFLPQSFSINKVKLIGSVMKVLNDGSI